MPASDYFTITGGSMPPPDYNEQPEYISFQLDVSGTITFKQNLTTYFTVIGGGGGGGGGSGPNGHAAGGYAGGGGGAGASGKISFLTVNNVLYSYEVGTGGGGGSGDINGLNGNDSSITFNPGTEYIIAYGGDFGAGYYGGSAGGAGGLLDITGVSAIIIGTSGGGGDGLIVGPPIRPAEDGSGNIPTFIEIYPGMSKLVGGGGGGGAELYGGGGGHGAGGAAPMTANPKTQYGQIGQTVGAGGGGCGYVGSFANDGGDGKVGAIFVYISLVDDTIFTKYDGTISIESIIGTISSNDYPTGWFKDEIKFVVIGNTVNDISYNAFSDSKLVSVTIPDSVISIPEYAFESISELTNVTINTSAAPTNGGTMFFNSTNIETVILDFSGPIVKNLFSSQTVLSSVTMSNVTSIGFESFAATPNLTSITIPNSVTDISGYAFESSGLTSLTIPSSVTSIGYKAFYDCSDLTSVSFESGSALTTIGEYAFSSSGLSGSITLPASLTSIGDYAFFQCTSSFYVSFESGSALMTISDNTFRLSGLTSITLPASLISIGHNAFWACATLTSVNFSYLINLETIDPSAFESTGLTSITIPSSVTSIGNQAFSYIASLTSVTFDSNFGYPSDISNNIFLESGLSTVYMSNSTLSYINIKYGLSLIFGSNPSFFSSLHAVDIISIIIKWDLANLYDTDGFGLGPFPQVGGDNNGVYTITGTGGPYAKTWVPGLQDDRNCNEFWSSNIDRINTLFPLALPPLTDKQFIVVNDPSASRENLLLMYPLTTDAMNYSFNMKPEDTATPHKYTTDISSSIWPPNISTTNLTLNKNIIPGTSSGIPIGTVVGILKTCNIDTDDFSYIITGGADASKFSISVNSLLTAVPLNSNASYTIIIKSTAVDTTDAQYTVSNTFNIDVIIPSPPPPPPPVPQVPLGPGPIQMCDSRFAKCNLNKKLGPAYSSGNVTIQGATNSQRMTELIRVQSSMRNAKLVFTNAPVNQYGRRAGGPSGYGQPPRNSFT